MMVLADTSVWVDHLRHAEARLVEELQAGRIAMHPMVLGELACGNLRFRSRFLALLAQLPPLPVASDSEVLHFIGERGLMGRGLGLIDVHLLASVLLAGATELWTKDRRLGQAAREILGS